MILDGPFPPDPRVENEALTLLSLGHELHLYCHHTNDFIDRINYKGIKVYRYPVSKYIKKISALAYTFPLYHWYLRKSIRAYLKEINVDAVHIHDMQVARTMFWLKKDFPNLPIVLDLHENRPEIMKFYHHVTHFPGNCLIFPKRWKKFEFSFIKKANRVIVVTEEARDYYASALRLDPDKFFIVPNYVRKEFYTHYELDQSILDQYKDRFVLLYLGDTGKRRGIKTMIEATEILSSKIPNVSLVIVGKSKDDQIWSKLVREKNLENHIELTGWKDFSKFQSYISASDIGLCPIHRNLHHDTTFANKIFQSLSFGKPVVVSDCTAQKNLVEKYRLGLVFKDRNPDALAKNIYELYKNNARYQEMAKNGESVVKNELNWDTIAETLDELYGGIK